MSDRYTIISADCHAGANHETYRGYLESKYLDDFDAWREKYRNPFRDLQDGGRVRNWDNERRLGDLYTDGQVGEVVFPNT
ncbi:MAG: amidohydrolase, partial [bacterium]|nr:amidohydrolase [bacterium]